MRHAVNVDCGGRIRRCDQTMAWRKVPKSVDLPERKAGLGKNSAEIAMFCGFLVLFGYARLSVPARFCQHAYI